MKKLLRMPGLHLLRLSYCQFGERWRKDTYFLTNREELLPLARTCQGSFARCSSTGEAHIPLRGVAPSGELWTKIACPYPWELCKQYAQLLATVAPCWKGPENGARRLRAPSAPAPPLREQWTQSERWRLLFRGKWKIVDHNNVLEARGILAVLRHLSRTRAAWHSRVLVRTDSMVSLGSMAKGRSSATALLRVCRASAAVQLAMGLRLYLRYVPSELNLADGPSRGLHVGVAPETKEAHRLRWVPIELQRAIKRAHGARVATGARHW